jgi:hypothetical protein
LALPDSGLERFFVVRRLWFVIAVHLFWDPLQEALEIANRRGAE